MQTRSDQLRKFR